MKHFLGLLVAVTVAMVIVTSAINDAKQNKAKVETVGSEEDLKRMAEKYDVPEILPENIEDTLNDTLYQMEDYNRKLDELDKELSDI